MVVFLFQIIFESVNLFEAGTVAFSKNSSNLNIDFSRAGHCGPVV